MAQSIPKITNDGRIYLPKDELPELWRSDITLLMAPLIFRRQLPKTLPLRMAAWALSEESDEDLAKWPVNPRFVLANAEHDLDAADVAPSINSVELKEHGDYMRLPVPKFIRDAGWLPPNVKIKIHRDVTGFSIWRLDAYDALIPAIVDGWTT